MPSRYFAVDEVVVDPNSRWAKGGDPGGRAWLHQAWREARRDAEQSDRGFVLALDEIRHVDRWSLIAKAQWDRDRRIGCPLRVIVAGSAPWSMMTGLHESLAGRFMPVRVSHWSYPEMAETFGFTLDQYLFFGGYPGMAAEMGDVDTWRAAVHDTIISPGHREGHRGHGPHREARAHASPDGFGCRLFRPDPLLQQDAGSAAGSRQRHNAGRVPRPALAGQPGHRAAEVLRGTVRRPRIEPEAERPQHRPDDGPTQAHVRGSACRPHAVGPDRRECRWEPTSTTQPD